MDPLRLDAQIQQRLAARLGPHRPGADARVVGREQLPALGRVQPVHANGDRVHRLPTPRYPADRRSHRLQRIAQPFELSHRRIAHQQARQVKQAFRRGSHVDISMRRRISPSVTGRLRQNRHIQNHVAGQQLPELLRHQLIADVPGAHPVTDLDYADPLHCKENNAVSFSDSHSVRTVFLIPRNCFP